jgi:hypothetical protein
MDQMKIMRAATILIIAILFSLTASAQKSSTKTPSLWKTLAKITYKKEKD